MIKNICKLLTILFLLTGIAQAKEEYSEVHAEHILVKTAYEAQQIKKAIDEKFYVDIQTVVMTNIDFSEAFENAVEEKMIAEQNQLKANYENEAKIAKAKADAEAKIVAAEAEAKSNDLLEKSLTDKILRQMYIEKWDGKLPNTVAGDTGSTIMIPAE